MCSASRSAQRSNSSARRAHNWLPSSSNFRASRQISQIVASGRFAPADVSVVRRRQSSSRESAWKMRSICSEKPASPGAEHGQLCARWRKPATGPAAVTSMSFVMSTPEISRTTRARASRGPVSQVPEWSPCSGIASLYTSTPSATATVACPASCLAVCSRVTGCSGVIFIIRPFGQGSHDGVPPNVAAAARAWQREPQWRRRTRGPRDPAGAVAGYVPDGVGSTCGSIAFGAASGLELASRGARAVRHGGRIAAGRRNGDGHGRRDAMPITAARAPIGALGGMDRPVTGQARLWGLSVPLGLRLACRRAPCCRAGSDSGGGLAGAAGFAGETRAGRGTRQADRVAESALDRGDGAEGSAERTGPSLGRLG